MPRATSSTTRRSPGSYTISHLRFGPRPIRAPYLLKSASFVGVHKFDFLFKLDTLAAAAPGATVLINSPYAAGRGLERAAARRAAADASTSKLKLYVIDASQRGRRPRPGVARQHHPADLLLRAVGRDAARQGDRGDQAGDRDAPTRGRARRSSRRTSPPSTARWRTCTRCACPAKAAGKRHAPDARARLGARLRAQRDRRPSSALRGDTLPVSALPVDGTYPTGTARYEKRNIADEVPVWESDLCIQCGQCAIVCPHSVIRAKYYDESRLDGRAGRRSRRCRSTRAAIPTRASRCRSTSRTAPAAACAWRTVRRTARPTPPSRRST